MNAMGINWDVWNQTSPKDQKVIEEIAAEMDKEKAGLDAFYKKNGVEIIKFSPQEEERMITTCTEPVWSDWTKTAEKKGLPADEWFKRFRGKLTELSK